LKYAILGARGQLGQAFLRVLGPEAIALTRQQIDMTKPGEIRAVLEAVQPEVVVNCTAYNWVDKAESEAATPFLVNALGVRDLAGVCHALGCVLIHYSTNYVFGLDEARRTPYREDDSPGPVGVYGTSKLAGEYFARTACAKHFVIRACGLYGVTEPGSTRFSFAELMLHLANKGGPIRVVNDQICSPTRTDDLVEATLALLATGAYGLYHLTSEGECTWHEFARAVFELAGKKVDLHGVRSEEFAAPAARPKYSVMANEAYSRLGLRPIRHWKESLAIYLRERLTA
jgi:dTDP-4-dehydrorhamnose reductase